MKLLFRFFFFVFFSFDFFKKEKIFDNEILIFSFNLLHKFANTDDGMVCFCLLPSSSNIEFPLYS